MNIELKEVDNEEAVVITCDTEEEVNESGKILKALEVIKEWVIQE